ncbi:MAG TPA: DUF1416 domain-containing protein [Jiangellaceae bacterium]|jgi:Protein of unknown function (DUF1416)|nr:DUF1416 domain-containing protein [Jiangellaceae bacterium]
MTTGCQAPAGGVSLEGVDLTKESVIQGVVSRAGAGPVAGAYVRLLDASGEFTAEVPTNEAGEFRFFAAPGEWTVRMLAPRAAPVDRVVVAERGAVAEVELSVTP